MKKYAEKLDKGLMTLKRTDDGTIIGNIKKFDSGTGEQLTDEVEKIDVKQWLEQKASLQEQIADIDRIISECAKIEG